jgi:uncharacterized membrane protein
MTKSCSGIPVGAISLLVGALASRPAFAQPTFYPIGHVYEGFDTWCLGVSADGNVLVGGTGSPNGARPIRWRRPIGRIEILPALPSGLAWGEAAAASADGSTIVGSGENYNPEGTYGAFRWTEAGGGVWLGGLLGNGGSEAFAVSGDGERVVGRAGSAFANPEAFLSIGGFAPFGLGCLTDQHPESTAWGISLDGTTIVGWSSSSIGYEPFVRTNGGSMFGLGRPPNTPSYGVGSAYAVSANGLSVVGSTPFGTHGSRAFRWTAAQGEWTDLNDSPPTTPPGIFANAGSYASAVSPDGSVIIGGVGDVADAFIWDTRYGMRLIVNELAAQGLDITSQGWTISEPAFMRGGGGVTRNGHTVTIVGTANGPTGRQGYVATLRFPRAGDVPAPSILSHPSNLDVCLGGVAQFSVTAAGGTPLSYQWRRNGVPLPGANAASLIISPVTGAHAGSYDVVVSNDEGTVRSNGAYLFVLAHPLASVGPYMNYRMPGQSATFAVSISHGVPPYSYQWTKDDIPISGAIGPTFTVTNISMSDAGIYRALVTDSCGRWRAQRAILAVCTEPVITFQPQSATACNGTIVELEVVASACLPAQYEVPFEYQWFCDDILERATGPTLSLDPVTEKDAGVYTVLVTNWYGSTLSNGANVVVEDCP